LDNTLTLPTPAKQARLFQRVAKGTFNYGLGSVLPKVIGFVLIPLYTAYLVPADYGIVEMCSSIATFVTIFSRLGMTGSVTRFYYEHKDKPDELQDYVTTVHRFLMVASVVMGTVWAIVFYVVGEKLTPGVLFFPFICIVLLNSAMGANSDLQKRLLQCTERSRYYAILSITNAMIAIATAIVLVVGFRLGALGLLLSQLLTSLILFVHAQFFLRSWTRGKFRQKLLNESLKYGMFTLPHHLFAAFAPLVSKMVLLHTNSLASLGIFALAVRFIQPLDITYAAFNQAWQPIYFSLRKGMENKGRIKRLSRIIWLAAVGLYLMAVFIVPPLIPLITPEHFHNSAPLVPILAMGFLWQVIYFLVSIDLFYLKKNQYATLCTMFGLLANLLVTFAFVKQWGVYTLAWAQVVGFMVWAVLSWYFVKKHGEMLIGGDLIRDSVLIMAMSGLAASYIGSGNLWVSLAALMVAFGVMAVLFHNYFNIRIIEQSVSRGSD
jgi:O-antigen/teichoic acid export membrane protein